MCEAGLAAERARRVSALTKSLNSPLGPALAVSIMIQMGLFLLALSIPAGLASEIIPPSFPLQDPSNYTSPCLMEWILNTAWMVSPTVHLLLDQTVCSIAIH